MICDFCRGSILQSGRPWGDHHDNASEFEKSAGGAIRPGRWVKFDDSTENVQKCIFCWKLAQNLRSKAEPALDSWLKPTNVDDENCHTIPVYRWALRKAAKVDEMEDYFVLAFTPVMIEEENQYKYKSRAQLPDAIFYLLKDKENLMKDQLCENTGQSWNQIKQWLRDCKSHDKCQQSNIGFMPTRLLDVGINSVPELEDGVGLRIVQSKPNQLERYVTLSHSWGPKSENEPYPFPQLLSGEGGTLEEFMNRGVPWKNISNGSKNFAHAIIVARQLGIKYIWIDSLCIIQNDEKDWGTESRLMHKIYRHSFCNISASDSCLPADGLFRGPRSEAYEGQSSTSIDLRGQRWRIVPADLWDTDLLKSPLYTRGWVFQERMLSPRMLHFASRQIFWDCAEKSACETFPQGIPTQLDWIASIERNWRQLLQNQELSPNRVDTSGDHANSSGLVCDSSGDPANSSSLFWKNAVRSYTGCKLTKHKDKLKAIWGIAKLVRDVEKDEYGGGLWALHLHGAASLDSTRQYPRRAGSWPRPVVVVGFY